jgi:hypothetical protein
VSGVQSRTDISSDDRQVKRGNPVRVCATHVDEPFLFQRVQKFSDWYQSRRAVTLCVGLKDFVRKHIQTTPCRSIKVENIEHAQNSIIKMMQVVSFAKDI